MQLFSTRRISGPEITAPEAILSFDCIEKLAILWLPSPESIFADLIFLDKSSIVKYIVFFSPDLMMILLIIVFLIFLCSRCEKRLHFLLVLARRISGPDTTALETTLFFDCYIVEKSLFFGVVSGPDIRRANVFFQKKI